MTRALARRAEVQQAIDAYYDSYVRAFNPPDLADRWLAEAAKGVKPSARSVRQADMTLPKISGGKNGRQLKDLIAAWGPEKVIALCREFPFMTHPRVRRSDYSLDALVSLAPFLSVQAAGADDDDRTAANRHAAQQATRGRRP